MNTKKLDSKLNSKQINIINRDLMNLKNRLDQDTE
jgi:hypothetical protein